MFLTHCGKSCRYQQYFWHVSDCSPSHDLGRPSSFECWQSRTHDVLSSQCWQTSCFLQVFSSFLFPPMYLLKEIWHGERLHTIKSYRWRLKYGFSCLLAILIKPKYLIYLRFNFCKKENNLIILIIISHNEYQMKLSI